MVKSLRTFQVCILCTFVIWVGCGNPAIEDLRIDFAAGEVCSGDVLEHEFQLRIPAGEDSVIQVGRFQSSCGCATASPVISKEFGYCVLKVPFTWKIPAASLAKQDGVVSPVSVESKGFVEIDKQRRFVTLKLAALVGNPVSVSEVPFRLQREDDGTELIIRREMLSVEQFTQIRCEDTEWLRFEETARSDSSLTYSVMIKQKIDMQRTSIAITGLSENIVLPVLANWKTSISLESTLAFASLMGGDWHTEFVFAGSNGMKPVEAHLVSDLATKIRLYNVYPEAFGLAIDNAKFGADEAFFVVVVFQDQNGAVEKVNVRVRKKK